MKKIESFTVNHLKLLPGLYISRVDIKDETTIVTTFDMRITAPNIEPVIGTGAIHTIEHIGATYLRNSSVRDDVIYFGPMGCRTGFYLVMFGKLVPADVYDTVVDMCDYIIGFDGEIPGAKPEECGNYSDQDLVGAKEIIKKYKNDICENKRFIYQN